MKTSMPHDSPMVKSVGEIMRIRDKLAACSARDWDGKDYLRIIPRVVW